MNAQTNQHPLQTGALVKRAMIGAAIALVLISVFLLTADGADPSWPKFWWIRPLLVVPAAGAMGGVFYTLMDGWRAKGGWKKIVANVLSVIVYIFGLWIGTVLGLDGTMWD